MLHRSNTSLSIAVASFVTAVVLSFIGMFCPPVGVLSESNLYVVAQFLLVTCSLCGVHGLCIETFNRIRKTRQDEQDK